MVYCCDKSMKLPRKRRRGKTVRSSLVKPVPYRATQHEDKPSLIDRHIVNGKWLSRDEQEAMTWLNSIG